mmetsp:Transcript_7637/g.15716  ORF Transcript_7637/g.15716 Transcript_7637/m.15716 type:complete len:448 (+) Transcript_7637:275-1618(+)|eukprot:CAMPEP_0201124614 /NCGR_PEP_ID=MMETSP0850-20130426/15941_1 /ASSEMBLY_ACC=CAM_ASM_000622 /TAXON_ID=183588 /ORGANISM="Pseudo-nitzschia fraudulenta, Strain WWA7" /LENGTH=447 /DNA_ID=CAMNT_0047392147 /DNA_START=122 /DNA_END=1465 /DNA_ORIENTATION=-
MPKSTKANSDNEEEWSSDGSDNEDGDDLRVELSAGDDSESDEVDDSEDDSEDDSGDDEDDDDDDSEGSNSEDDGDDPQDFEDEEDTDESYDRDAPYGGPERFDDDEKMKNNGHWWDGREKVVAGALLGCCCLILIIIGIVVGVVVGGRQKKDDGTSLPTLRPTPAPQPLPPSALTAEPSVISLIEATLSPTLVPTSYPTLQPTISIFPTIAIAEEVELFADQDTFVILDGEFQGDENGSFDTFLVQNGPAADESLADTVGLLSFSTKILPAFKRLTDLEKTATLRLTHQVSIAERDPASYTIIRIPETRVAVEYLNGFFFRPPEEGADGVLVGEEFEVKPDQKVVNIDVTDLLFDYKLQPGTNPEHVLLMIQNLGGEQVQGGDRFFTRESDNTPYISMTFDGSNVVESNITDIGMESEVDALLQEDEVGLGSDIDGSNNTTDESTGV